RPQLRILSQTQAVGLGLGITAPWAVVAPTSARVTNLRDDDGGETLSSLFDAHDREQPDLQHGPILPAGYVFVITVGSTKEPDEGRSQYAPSQSHRTAQGNSEKRSKGPNVKIGGMT